MNELYKLLFFSFFENENLGEVSDKKLETINSFLHDVDLLTLRLAQLNFNERIKSDQKYWWDDLKVYLGLHKSNTSELSVLSSSTSVPFGLLFEVFEISGSNQSIAIKYNWDILERDGLFHTDVDEFSTYSMAQEWDILNDEGFLPSAAGDKWLTIQSELENQIVHSPRNYVTKKTTLIIIELLSHRMDILATERLKAFIKIYMLLEAGDVEFSDIEKFLVYDRAEVEVVGGYVNEIKPYEQFDLNDFFDFGFQLLELSHCFEHDFDVFFEYVEDIINQKDTERWSKDELGLLDNLYKKTKR